MSSDVVLVIVVGTALAFDFTNGFHDTANVVATSISTRAMSPRIAVTYAAILNFAGAFISLEVAATVASDVVVGDVITPTIVFAGLIGAISWNLATWYFGLPSSSSHALIGCDRDCARHLHGRLAHHQDDGDAHHQDGRGAWVLRSGRGLRRDPRLEPL